MKRELIAASPIPAAPSVADRAVERALQLLWASTAIGRLGDSITMVALVWVVFEVTGSAAGQASFQFAYTSVIAVGSLLVGAVLDRYRVVPAMVADGLGRAVIGGVVIFALALNVAVLPAALLVAVYLGLTLHFAGNGFPAIVAAALAPAAHPRANMIEALAGATAGITGPVVAGALIASSGVSAALIAGAVASLVGALVLWAGRRPLADRLPPRSVGIVGRAGIAAGIRYVWQRPVLLSTALAFAGGSVFGVMATVALPLYATQVLRADVGGYAALVSAASLGAIPGIIVGRAVAARIGVGWAMVGGMLIAGLLQAALGLIHDLPAAVALTAGAGFVGGSTGAWANTLRMANMDAAMRGRAFGAMRAITHAPAPFAALAAAWVVPAVGIPGTFILAGGGAIAMGIGLALVRGIREG